MTTATLRQQSLLHASTSVELELNTAALAVALIESSIADAPTERVHSISAEDEVELEPDSLGLLVARFSDSRYCREVAQEEKHASYLARCLQSLAGLRAKDARRAAHVEEIAARLRFSMKLRSRDEVFDAHERACHLRAGEKDRRRWREQEDQLLALALIAQARNDEHEVLVRKTRQRLTQRGARCVTKMELRVALSTLASRDLGFLSREMLRAVEDGDEHLAELCAFASACFPHAPFCDPEKAPTEPTPRYTNDKSTELSKRDAVRLEAELDEARVHQALGQLDARGAARADRVAGILAKLQAKTA